MAPIDPGFGRAGTTHRAGVVGATRWVAPLSSGGSAALWLLALAGVAVLVILVAARLLPSTFAANNSRLLLFGVALAAFFCEYVDSSLGMGYGTSLTPILLAVGLAPLDVVPAVLISQLVAGILASAAHHRVGNVSFHPGGWALKLAVFLGLSGAFGALLAVYVALRLPPRYLHYYIGSLVLVVGVWIIISRNLRVKFGWKKTLALGVLAAFNKGISGGGYGPLVTAGQIVNGVNPRAVVGITSLAESFVCLVAFGAYLFGKGMGSLPLTIALLLGASLSVPVSAWTVSKIEIKFLRLAIGLITIILGASVLVPAILSR